jgi:hypothetical protein
MFKAILGYTARPYLKKHKNKNIGTHRVFSHSLIVKNEYPSNNLLLQQVYKDPS